MVRLGRWGRWTIPCLLSAGLAWGASNLEGLLLYLPLDEGSGDVVRDASGRGFQGEATATQ
ncbi:MAG: hypothetical protein KatS3mg115_1060 [Candidatus Poribacteria bacterium]|nr:MAG: hypothetical protein KatS3mg115_1060 [Candidatus Poribacteria bacterium]